MCVLCLSMFVWKVLSFAVIYRKGEKEREEIYAYREAEREGEREEGRQERRALYCLTYFEGKLQKKYRHGG